MKKSITILEDDRDIREICTMLFMDEGYGVDSFENIKSFNKRPTRPSLFLLDVQLPDGNGLDLCEKLKTDENFAYIPIIMMSAHLHKATMMKQSLADDFIEKPFDIERLLQRVALLIG